MDNRSVIGIHKKKVAFVLYSNRSNDKTLLISLVEV